MNRLRLLAMSIIACLALGAAEVPAFAHNPPAYGEAP